MHDFPSAGMVRIRSCGSSVARSSQPVTQAPRFVEHGDGTPPGGRVSSAGAQERGERGPPCFGSALAC